MCYLWSEQRVWIGDRNRSGCSSRSSARRKFMSESGNESDKHSSAELRETPGDYGFELPIEPNYRERPPQGSWEAGYRLSLMALEMVKNRPEIFDQRDQR